MSETVNTHNPIQSFTTTSEHFAIFQQEAKYWIEWFSLMDWKVGFQHREDLKESLAQCWGNSRDRNAQLVLATDWAGEDPTPDTLSRVAFHEVAELWLVNLCQLAEARNYDSLEAEKETHRLIRLLENRVWANTNRLDSQPRKVIP